MQHDDVGSFSPPGGTPFANKDLDETDGTYCESILKNLLFSVVRGPALLVSLPPLQLNL